MRNVLEEKEKAVAIGQAKMDEVTKQFQSATAAADSTLVRLLHHKHSSHRSDVVVVHSAYINR